MSDFLLKTPGSQLHGPRIRLRPIVALLPRSGVASHVRQRVPADCARYAHPKRAGAWRHYARYSTAAITLLRGSIDNAVAVHARPPWPAYSLIQTTAHLKSIESPRSEPALGVQAGAPSITEPLLHGADHDRMRQLVHFGAWWRFPR